MRSTLSWLCKLFYLALLPEVAILSMSRVYFGGKCHNVDFILILDFVVSCFVVFFKLLTTSRDVFRSLFRRSSISCSSISYRYGRPAFYFGGELAAAQQ